MAQVGVPSVRSLDPSTNYQAVDAENIRQISPKDILLFAKQILLYLFFLVLFVFALSYATAWVSPQNQTLSTIVGTILDITKTAVPSIVTLVLGFYFGSKNQAAGNGGSQ